jgi:hypothetical protein
MKSISKIAAFLGSFLMVGTVAGVAATFTYIDNPVSVIANQNFGVAQFEYAPEEVLPDTPEDTVNQSNHHAVIHELLFNNKMGLNGGGTSVPSQVEKYGLLPYLQNITGGNLKHLIDVSEGGKNLGFDLEYINDDSFYAYSYYRYDHTHGETIVAYRTLIEKNTDPNYDHDGDGRMDKWKASTSVQGWAPALEYAYDKKQGKMQFRIDVEKWTNYEGII